MWEKVGSRVVVAVTLTALLVAMQSRLYWPPANRAGPGQISPDLLSQLRFLRRALERGAVEEMQALFPEGYFFSHVLTHEFTPPASERSV